MITAAGLAGHTRSFVLVDWVRIIPSVHAANPTGVGFGSSRFSSTTGAFRVLYAAEDFATAFAEAVVRDRFVGKRLRVLYQPVLDALSVTLVASDPSVDLLDLTGSAVYRLGLDTDAAAARDHAQGQSFSEWLHSTSGVDGILYESRITGGRCAVIYDRALPRIVGAPARDLVTQPELADEIRDLRITVRARYVPRRP